MENWKERIELSNRLILEFGATGDNDTTSISCKLDKLLDILEQELDKAREEGFNDGVEKTVGIIQKELDELLLQKDDEKYKKRLMELDEFVKKKDEEKKLAKLKEDSKNGRKNIFSKKV